MKNKLNLAVIILSGLAFSLLAICVKSGTITTFNETAYAQISILIHPSLTNVMIFISNAGEWFVYIPIAFLFLLVPKSRYKIGVPAAISLGVSAILNYVLKLCFAIPRPDAHQLVSEIGYSFPSGHAMNGTAFIVICACLFLVYANKHSLKVLIFVIAAAFLFAVGFSRVYLGVHNAADVIGGYLAGIFVCSLCCLLIIFKQNLHPLMSSSVK